MATQGLTNDDLRDFSDLRTKANVAQLVFLRETLGREISARIARRIE